MKNREDLHMRYCLGTKRRPTYLARGLDNLARMGFTRMLAHKYTVEMTFRID